MTVDSCDAVVGALALSGYFSALWVMYWRLRCPGTSHVPTYDDEVNLPISICQML